MINCIGPLVQELTMADIPDAKQGRNMWSYIFILSLHTSVFNQSKCESNNRLFRNPFDSEDGWSMPE